MKQGTADPRAGDVWDVRLGPVMGAEQGGVRPALVISSNEFNRIQPYLVFIAPITGTDRGLEYQVQITGRQGGLSKHPVIMCDQARAISVRRLLNRRGEVSDDVLRSVQVMVGRLIDASGEY